MSVARFFLEDVRTGRATLPPEEAAHAAHARRLAAGDEIAVFDGAGHEASGRIVAVARRCVEVELGSVKTRARQRPELMLATAIPKGPRQEFLIEKCTELGVAAIRPLLTRRSVSQASDHKLARWRRTAIEAAKQSGQCWIPELLPPATLEEVLAGSGGIRILALDREGASGPDFRAAAPMLVLIGPEGGWAPEELEEMRAAGAEFLRLGPSTLRIETAAIAVAALAHATAQNFPSLAS